MKRSSQLKSEGVLRSTVLTFLPSVYSNPANGARDLARTHSLTSVRLNAPHSTTQTAKPLTTKKTQVHRRRQFSNFSLKTFSMELLPFAIIVSKYDIRVVFVSTFCFFHE